MNLSATPKRVFAQQYTFLLASAVSAQMYISQSINMQVTDDTIKIFEFQRPFLHFDFLEENDDTRLRSVLNWAWTKEYVSGRNFANVMMSPALRWTYTLKFNPNT